MPRLTPSEFAAKWKGSHRAERAAAQEHFIDLCRLLGVPTPNEADPRGEWYAFEKGAHKQAGGEGFADVWKRGHFAWEYKGKRKDLRAAYSQLLQYREALENPPCLVVCDMDRFEVHTNFTGTAKAVHAFTLADLARDPGEPLKILRAVMSEPEALRPAVTRTELTERAAGEFAVLARALRGRGHEARRVAHFLNKLLFTMFAEDSALLPQGLLERLAGGTGRDPTAFGEGLKALFERMAHAGGLFGVDRIDWFNGGLFDGNDVLPLTREDIQTVERVSRLDWSQIEPAIFGTLFERGLDPESRTALGAHYTDRESILKVVRPVVIAPLRREFEGLKAEVEQGLTPGRKGAAATRAKRRAEAALQSFLARLAAVRVLDPACGSGNFLYVALHELKDLEREVRIWGSERLEVPIGFPTVGPECLLGIELNEYAAELARVTIWIGEIQWMLAHGFAYRTNPILQPLDNIECRDAILDRDMEGLPVPARWPDAEFVIGNPPFLGGKVLRTGLGDATVDALFQAYEGRVPREADLVTYWFERAREQIERGKTRRAGLLATQGIRGGANRRVLERIAKAGALFMAWSDQPWVLDGAAVHVSIVGFDGGVETERVLDGRPVSAIHADLTSGADLTRARRLPENAGLSFMADTKGGPFDIPEELARQLLAQPNPDGRSNADVVRPWANGLDITRRPRGMWIIDFGVGMAREEAALYEAPFAFVQEKVCPIRKDNRRQAYAERWWQHVEPRPQMRAVLAPLTRYLATPAVAKHRLFVWLTRETLPDHQLIVVAREDDFTFGVLQSRVHERWALALGTQLESRPRYTPTTTFETFPFPEPTEPQRERVEGDARELDRLRTGWLNPPGASAAELKRRTLTNLYNAPPAWLVDVSLALDRAVLAAYGCPEDWAEGLQPLRGADGKVNPALGVEDPAVEQELLSRLLDLNLARSSRRSS